MTSSKHKLAARQPPLANEVRADLRFPDRLAAVAGDVEALLAHLLAETPRAGEVARPQRLLAAMQHAVLAGGKRLRPFLTVEAARLLGRADGGPLRAGTAIELLHGYSLVHDDLPAMDDDDLRRGKPTVHKAFDEATAILAGDALQTETGACGPSSSSASPGPRASPGWWEARCWILPRRGATARWSSTRRGCAAFRP